MKKISTLFALLCIIAVASAQTTVTKSGSVFAQYGGGLNWSGLSSLSASDNVRASASDASLLGSGTEGSQTIQVKGFNFSIPLNATITAVQVRIERRRTSGNVYDNSLLLLKGGSTTGSNKAATGTNWPLTEATVSYGNTTGDLWGTTLTPFDVNSPNFGIEFSALLNNPSIVLGSVGADIDYIDLSVTYTTAGASDKDNDGRPDLMDFDADNDGLPNNRELTRAAASNSFVWTGQADGTSAEDVDVTSGGLTVNTAHSTAASITTFGIDNTYSATSEKEVHIVQTGSSVLNKTTLTFSFSKAIANLQFYIQDIDASAGQFTDNIKVTAYYMGQPYALSASEVTTSASNSFIGGNTIQGISTAPDNTTNGQVFFKLATIADKIVIEYWNSDAGAGNQGMGIGGWSYAELSTMDSDGDGIPNYLDSDSDGDGIPDLAEAGGVDTDGDGHVDGPFADTDGDGLADKYDLSVGGIAMVNTDSDGDGIPNSQDLDSDNDGLPDVIEARGADTNNDGKLDSTTDTDGDGLADIVDADANGDGIAENSANALLRTGADANNDGAPDSYPYKNTDINGLPDMYDLDSDGDGILDVTEIGLADADKNGMADGIDANGDGWSDTIDALASITPLNTDGDALPDYRDIDSDNDGITDNVEGMSTLGYLMPSGVDADKDGIDDAYDNNPAAFGGNANNGNVPYNFDNDALPDYRDIDSDNDGLLDVVEGHDYNMNGIADDNVTLTGIDSDGDGLDDTFDLGVGPMVRQNGIVNGGVVGNPSSPGAKGPLQKTNIVQTDRDWRFSNAIVLPLTLLSFDGQLQDASTHLSWTVTHAAHVRSFEVEKSTNGSTFSKIGTVSFSLESSYGFVDGQVSAPRNFYRLRIVDENGSSTYSRVVTINAGQSKTGVNLYPNPASQTAYVQLAGVPQGTVYFSLANAGGQVVRSWQATNNGADMPVQVSGLQKGQYFLTIQGSDRKAIGTEKIMVN